MVNPDSIPLQGKGEEPRLVRQHLIDPETCLRCGGCQATCPEGAVHFDPVTFVYAIDPNLCDGVHECVSVCSSNAINTWHVVPAERVYSLQEQFSWESLPEQAELYGQSADIPVDEELMREGTVAPASASEPVTYLYTLKKPVVARIKSNERITGGDTDVHHVVLDFAGSDFQWLEGQNIGLLPEGRDDNGREYLMRAYSIASARDGETPGSQEVALTIKRLVDEWEGAPYYGVCSNFVCDMEAGGTIRVVGPIGDKFLFPEHPRSRIMMIATGTGIAPMRAFVQRQQRSVAERDHPMQLFYGGRTPDQMAYCGELLALPDTKLRTYLALSRSKEEPRQYVQDKLLEQANLVASFLKDENGYLFVCGLIRMEQAVMEVLAQVAGEQGMDWNALHHQLLRQGRLQVEVY